MRHPNCFRVLVLNGALICGLWLSGCGSSEDKTPDPSTKTLSQKTEKPPAKTQPPPEEKPKPEDVWNRLETQAETQLAAGELDEASMALAELEAVYQDPDQPTEEQLAKLEELQKQLAEKLEVQIAQKRVMDLAEAERLMTVGKFTEATQKVNEVIAAAPTIEQRNKTNVILAEIARLRKARRDLRTWVQLLELEDRSSISTAHSNLLRQPDVALGMMIEASENAEKPILAANALEVLRMLKRPQETIPAMIAVLKRPEQKTVWPAAVQELGRMEQPGAGEPLLKLALETEDSGQRIAALDALAQVKDIPNRTFAAVLPFLLADGPELAAALNVAYQAVRTHNQYDFLAQRGFETFLTEDQAGQFAKLPARLKELTAKPTDDEGENDVVRAAKVLAWATHQVPPQPLEDIKVHRAEAEYPESPAKAVLDGVWNSIDLTTMWRHPISERSTITLDLGETKTVAGVRLWNFNQQYGSQRGWKDVEIFVSDSPTALSPAATGILLRAPGAADTPDYSTVIPVPFVRGRYVRLYAKSLWDRNDYTGLSEIQVLGF